MLGFGKSTCDYVVMFKKKAKYEKSKGELDSLISEGADQLITIAKKGDFLNKSMDEIGQYHKRFTTEAKYLIVANVGALIFCIEKLGFKLDEPKFELDRLYLMPFLLGFVSAAFAYWKGFSLDSTVTIAREHLKRLGLMTGIPKSDLVSRSDALKKMSEEQSKIIRKTESFILTFSDNFNLARMGFNASALFFSTGVCLIVTLSFGVDLFGLITGLIK